MKPIILLSNDDSIYASGIQTLYSTLHKNLGHLYDIIIVAPDRNNSATSHSITLKHPLRVTQIKKNFYTVDGTPSDCVNIALKKIVSQKPSLIISGINEGANIGHDVFYSGTVSAACEGALQGVPSLAVSEMGYNDHEKNKFYLKPAANFVTKFTKSVLENKFPPFRLLSINVPSIPEKQIKGIRYTKLGSNHYSTDMVERIDPHGLKYY